MEMTNKQKAIERYFKAIGCGIKTRIDAVGYEVYWRSDRNHQPIKMHVVIAEKVLGKPLPNGAIVHHSNGVRSDNRPANLVICPDRAYHHLLHQRMKAKEACGHADWLKCQYCKRYDAPDAIFNRGNGKSKYHRACANKFNREYKAKKKAAVEAATNFWESKND